MPSIGVGQIFTFGATAALAWELPSEPEQVFEIFGKHKTTTTTTTTTTTEHPTLPVSLFILHTTFKNLLNSFILLNSLTLDSKIYLAIVYLRLKLGLYKINK